MSPTSIVPVSNWKCVAIIAPEASIFVTFHDCGNPCVLFYTLLYGPCRSVKSLKSARYYKFLVAYNLWNGGHYASIMGSLLFIDEAAKGTLDCTVVTQSNILRKFYMECAYLFTQLVVKFTTYLTVAFRKWFNPQCFNYLTSGAQIWTTQVTSWVQQQFKG